jgi:hypothetical protein
MGRKGTFKILEAAPSRFPFRFGRQEGAVHHTPAWTVHGLADVTRTNFVGRGDDCAMAAKSALRRWSRKW